MPTPDRTITNTIEVMEELPEILYLRFMPESPFAVIPVQGIFNNIHQFKSITPVGVEIVSSQDPHLVEIPRPLPVEREVAP